MSHTYTSLALAVPFQQVLVLDCSILGLYTRDTFPLTSVLIPYYTYLLYCNKGFYFKDLSLILMVIGIVVSSSDPFLMALTLPDYKRYFQLKLKVR